jgi:transposase
MNKITGIDISKQTFDCSITLNNGEILVRQFSNNLKGFEKLKSLLPEQSQVVMEASGPYYFKLAMYLHQEQIKLSVVNPLVIRRFCQMRLVRTKTDRKDASMIREYGITEQPSLWQPDEKNITKLKQLNSSVDLIEGYIGSITNHLEALEAMPDTAAALIKNLKKILKYNVKEKEKLEQEMYKIAREEYTSTFNSLLSIPGIGAKTAAILIAVTGDFKKFDNYKQLTAYVGLNPRIFESGTSVKGRGHICKMGNSKLRKLLYMCSWSAKQVNPDCKEMYERLKAKSKPERVIKIAICCKLLRQAFAVGSKHIYFEKNYHKSLAI